MAAEGSAGGLTTSSHPHPGEVDIYRDTPVRLLGYANEVGEAFRALVGAGQAPLQPILSGGA